jgi:small subunit ribosomal protein S13
VARVAGVDIPDDKKVPYSLAYIYGIGIKTGFKICEKAGIDPEKRVKELSKEEIAKIRKIIETEYKVEGELRKEIAMNIKRLIEIGCYRGVRHKLGLPVRGQRTRTNARTRKGPRKTVAGKKKPPKK